MLTAILHAMRQKKRVVIATSGGPDSQALLHMLASWRETLGFSHLWAVGINHQLRQEALQELEYAGSLAKHLGVPFAIQPVEVKPQGNVLQAARQARYKALYDFAALHQADCVAVGHTASDQVETILYHLIRGTGLRGATGIHAQRGLIVRPLLHLSRQDIMDYIHTHGIAYAVDPSNADMRRSRAILRQALNPAFGQINRRYAQHFNEFAKFAQADEACLHQQAQQLLQQALGPCQSLQLKLVRKAPAAIAWRVLRLWWRLHKRNWPPHKTVTQIWQACQGSQPATLGLHGQILRISHDTLWLEHEKQDNSPLYVTQALNIPGKTQLLGFQACLVSETTHVDAVKMSQFAPLPSQSVAFDAEKLHFTLKVRSWQPKDALQPFGRQAGTIKVGDLFTNSKIPRVLRRIWPVVTHGTDVVWVVGLRRGSLAPVGPHTTRMINLTLRGALW